MEINPPHVSVCDLGSLNGTYVNDEPWRTDRREVAWTDIRLRNSLFGLRNDDVLRVGDISFREHYRACSHLQSDAHCSCGMCLNRPERVLKVEAKTRTSA